MLGPFSWCSTFFTSDCSVVTHAQRQSNRGNEMCDNEMSRDHDAPLEYLRILASLKLRFGLAALGTAHEALPVRFPIEEQGHSATQCLRGILTFPMVALDTQLSDSRDGSSSNILGLAEHPSTSGRLPTPDALLVDFQQRGDLRGADPFTDRYFVRSNIVAISRQQVTPIQVVLSSIPPRPGE